MALSSELISKFVKVTKDEPKNNKETVVYGVVTQTNPDVRVRLIESDSNALAVYGESIPVTSQTTVVAVGDKVECTIKNHKLSITGTSEYPAARRDDTAHQADIDAANGRIENLESSTARIDDLVAANVTIQDTLDAHQAVIDELDTTYVRADELEAEFIKAEDIEVDCLKSNQVKTTFATVSALNAVDAKISNLEAVEGNIHELTSDVADINTLIFGSATGDVIQTSFSNAVIAQLGDAQIKSAMIENISANKITAGDIITNNVRVMSEDGSLVISDETLQISDGNRIRVQIGKDNSNDYSINIWDQNGNLMFSKGGITDAAIKDAIIRNDMVSDNANIHASKLNVDSLFEEINDSSNTIKSTQIYLDEEGQTLDVAFKTLSTEVDNQGETISSQGTQISTIQGQISSKVWQQDIDTAKNEMSTQYSSLSQEIDNVESTVSTTYATKVEVKNVDEKVDNVKIGSRNLFKKTGDFDSSMWGQYISVEPYENNTLYKQAKCGGNTYLLSTLTVDQGFDFSDTTKTWTISVMAKGTNDEQMLGITLDADRTYFGMKPIENGKWSKISWTFQGSKSLITFRYEGYNASADSPIYLAQAMAEEGNRASDWRPAPEDVDNDILAAKNLANNAQATADQNATDMANAITSFNSDIANLQTQIDGSITTWFYEVPPTDYNEPAINWTSVDLKNIHLGDIYYDTVTGYCYRWQVSNNTYSWQRITDTDVTKALNDAQRAQDTADNKRRIFYTTPTAPYDPGDLWVQGSAGEILYSKTTKTSGQSYSESDWVTASKYTDDTVANEAKNAANVAQNTAEMAQSDIDNLEIGGRNLIVRSQSLVDRYYDQLGNLAVDNAGTAAMTTYIPIKPNTPYTFSRSAGNGDYFRFNWYDSNKNYLSRKAITEIGNNLAGEYTWTSPSDAYYVLVSYPWDEASRAKMERGNRATDWTPAPEDVENEITSVETRVTTAETKITQNTDSITSVADRTTVVENKFAGYSTTEQMNSAIEQKANEITSTVESTYATKTALSSTDTKATNAVNAAANAQADIDNLNVGGTNLLRNSNFAGGTTYWTPVNATLGIEADDIFRQCMTLHTVYPGDTQHRVYADTYTNFTHTANTEYTLSFWAKASENTTIQTNVAGSMNVTNHDVTTSWTKFTKTYTATAQGSITFWPNVANVTIYLANVKLELGNVITDWSPSPKDMETRIESAESKITQNANSITSVVSRTSNNETAISSLEQTASGLTARLDTTDANVTDAAKTATNYLNFSDDGLVVGDHTASTLDKNIRIDADSIDIRDGDKILASYQGDKISLGIESDEAVIGFCGDNATLTAVKDSSGYYDGIRFDSQYFRTRGNNVSMITDVKGTEDSDESKYGRLLMTSAESTNKVGTALDTVVNYGEKQNFTHIAGGSTADDDGASTYATVSAEHYTGSIWKQNVLKIEPTQTTLSDLTHSGLIRPWNKVLWSGAWYMNGSQEASLSEAITAQPNGVVLIFSEFYDEAASDTAFHEFFIPKQMITSHKSCGHCFQMSTSNLAYFATKYLYIGDSAIKGHANNVLVGDSTCGIARTNTRFVMRYVIGV